MKKAKVEVRTWSPWDNQESPQLFDDNLNMGLNVNPDESSQINNVAALEGLAWLLDSSIPLPGLKMRIGLDSIIGLIPILGDALGALISSYILFVAAKMGVPRVTLLRMGLNVTMDSLLGLIPFAGDFMDAAFKSNLRNVQLLRTHIENPTRARRGDWFFAGLFILAILAILGLFGWAAYALQLALRNYFFK